MYNFGFKVRDFWAAALALLIAGGCVGFLAGYVTHGLYEPYECAALQKGEKE